MSKPVAVISGDIHFTTQTLEPASIVVKQMIMKAKELNVPVILNGDTLDSKAIIRAECANRLIELVQDCTAQVYVNTGNHDLINEKATESSLNFLSPYCDIVRSAVEVDGIGWIIPYQSSVEAFLKVLSGIPKGSRLIIHQGLQSASFGHYISDKSAIPKDVFEDYRVIASHYHQAQDIKCGRPRKGAVGLFSYIGNPYTLTFGEAQDGPKGYQILHDNGLLEFVSLNLRRHIIKEVSIEELPSAGQDVRSEDLLWIKVHGRKSELDKLKKQDIAKMVGRDSFKLDLIPHVAVDDEEIYVKEKDDTAVLDALIDRLNEPEEWQAYLKSLWRDIVG